MIGTGRSRAERADDARELLGEVGLGHRAGCVPVRARAASASAWPSRGRWPTSRALLLADEPTGALDTVAGARWLDLMEAVRERRGTTMLVVSYDPAVAERAGRELHLTDGRLIAPARTAPVSRPGPGGVRRLTRQAGYRPPSTPMATPTYRPRPKPHAVTSGRRVAGRAERVHEQAGADHAEQQAERRADQAHPHALAEHERRHACRAPANRGHERELALALEYRHGHRVGHRDPADDQRQHDDDDDRLADGSRQLPPARRRVVGEWWSCAGSRRRQCPPGRR